MEKVNIWHIMIRVMYTSSVLVVIYLPSVLQFSSVFYVSVTLDARGCLAWTSLGIILFLRSLYSKFKLKYNEKTPEKKSAL